jgi:hypothetical protein
MLTLFHNNEQYPLENSEYYIRELASGLDEAIFTIDIHDPIYAILAEEENVVDRAGQTYKVKQIDAGAHDAKVICQLDIDEWRATLVVNYNSGTKTCYDQINAVKPAGWTVYDRAHIGIGRTLEGDLTPYDVCVQCTEVYSVYVRWDNKRKECTIYPKTLGTPVGAFATRELNLKEINYKGKSNDLITRLYAYGKDGLSFASINGGKPYVDNNTYESRTICGIWRDERYEVAQNLLDDATAKLAKMSRPERTYECSIVDLQATNPELYNNLDFSLFTTATLIDDIKNTSVDYQVVERHIYPYHPEMNEVIFNSEPMKITASVVDIKYQIESPNSTFQQIMDKKAAEATDWMLSGNGYVVAIQSSDGQWKELLFMDTNDISTAQKVLRINENGIGFSTTGASGPYSNAWTINGQLVADFITTGHMLLDRLQGGTVTIGGKATGVYQNGTLKVKDANDNDIASISNTGITFNSNNFKVDNQGKLTATSATITGDITATSGSFTGTVNASSGSFTGTVNASGGYFKSGYIGTNGDWEITGDGIHSKNGPTAATGQSTRGTYVGKDGLCCNGASTHVWISDGAISTNGTIYTSGTVDTNDLLIRDDFDVEDSGSTYRGATGQITWSAGGTAHSIAFHKGIITGYS